MSALTQARQAPKRDAAASFGDLLYHLLALTGWCATTLLAAAGCFVAVFAGLGNGSLGGFFQQMGLLAGHYLSSDAAARDRFAVQLLVAAVSAVVLTGFFRRGALVSIFRGGAGHGQQRAQK